MTGAISGKKYAELLTKNLPRVIENDRELKKVIAEVQAFMIRADSLTPEEDALLDLMIALVENYESKKYGDMKSSVTPLNILEHLMDSNFHTAKDLWEVVGDKGTVSKILSGERAISKSIAKRLANFYHVSPSLFI